MKYIWQHKHWPDFEYDLSNSLDLLYRYAVETSHVSASLEHLPAALQIDAIIDVMVSEGTKTSQIEGEKLNQEDVRSSIRNQLGLVKNPEVIKDPRAQGIAQLMIAVRKNYMQPLTKEELFAWNTMILFDPYRQIPLEIGTYRTSKEPLQIISGAIGKETMHFEAPPSNTIEKEMSKFIRWFNESSSLPGPVRAAIAHLYFECIHPFEDGNGRVGRALVEKILSQDQKTPTLLSLSATLERNKRTYYDELSLASKNGLDITRWVDYFINVIFEALEDSKKQIDFIVRKAAFYNTYAAKLNERQTKVIARMFKAGLEGFKGGMSAQKYMNITGCSKATATRDLKNLLDWGCIEKMEGGGRNIKYALRLPSPMKIII